MYALYDILHWAGAVACCHITHHMRWCIVVEQFWVIQCGAPDGWLNHQAVLGYASPWTLVPTRISLQVIAVRPCIPKFWNFADLTGQYHTSVYPRKHRFHLQKHILGGAVPQTHPHTPLRYLWGYHTKPREARSTGKEKRQKTYPWGAGIVSGTPEKTPRYQPPTEAAEARGISPKNEEENPISCAAW